MGIQSYAVDSNDVYPTTVDEAATNDVSVTQVSPWPKNPYATTAGAFMDSTGGAGNYTYTLNADGTFTLEGFGNGGASLITVP